MSHPGGPWDDPRVRFWRFEKLRLFGGGPIYSKLGRRVVYRIEDLDNWIAANRHSSTSDTQVGRP